MARQVYNPGFTPGRGSLKGYEPPPKADPVKIPDAPDKNITDRYGRPFERPNFAMEELIIEQLGKLGETYKTKATAASKQTISAFEGLSGYEFSINPDGTLNVKPKSSVNKGWKEDEAISSTLNQMGQNVYSSHARKLVGDALGQLGKYAAETLQNYASRIIDLNDWRQETSVNLNKELQGYIDADAMYLKDHPPPPPDDFVHAPIDANSIPLGSTIMVHASYTNSASGQVETLRGMYPGFEFSEPRKEKDEHGNDIWRIYATRVEYPYGEGKPEPAPASASAQGTPPGAQGPEGYNTNVPYGGGTIGDQLGAQRPDGKFWFGSGPPNKEELSDRWGIPVNQIGVTQKIKVTLKDGREFTVPLGTPMHNLGANPDQIASVGTIYIAVPKR